MRIAKKQMSGHRIKSQRRQTLFETLSHKTEVTKEKGKEKKEEGELAQWPVSLEK